MQRFFLLSDFFKLKLLSFLKFWTFAAQFFIIHNFFICQYFLSFFLVVFNFSFFGKVISDFFCFVSLWPFQTPVNQKFGLLEALLKVGAWNHAEMIISRFEQNK